MTERDTIFISHSTPQDNEFSIWIASRLEMLGYKVWVDKNGLLGGERFWPTIQKAIDQSVKILFVYSKNIVTAEGVLKNGIENELEYGKSIAYENGLKDFIIPLHIDNSAYHLAIGMPNINHIPFSDNWADGLKQLLRKLEKDNIPKNGDASTSSFSEWYENVYSSDISIIKKRRLYYSSWLGFNHLPSTFYIYRFQSEAQAKHVRELNPDLPLNRINNVITTFEPRLILKEESEIGFGMDVFNTELAPLDKFEVDVRDLYCPEYFSEEFPTFLECKNAFRRLMMGVWNALLRKKGLSKHILSGNKFAFYRPFYSDSPNSSKIKFSYPFSNDKRKKTKGLNGKYKDLFWHYAISGRFLLEPDPCFKIKSHLVFSTDGKNMVNDDKKMHKYRRDKGKLFFNEEWRDLFLAMLQSLKDCDGKIEIPVASDGEYVSFHQWPDMFWSNFDYIDPKKGMSIEDITDYYEAPENNKEYDA